jgi:putative phosphoesterase
MKTIGRVGLTGLIGLISDTHGLLRPEALWALEDSDLIIHAGDVGDPKILEELRRLAPVVAVRGNIDTGASADLPETAVAKVGTALIYVLHDIGKLDLKPEAAGMSMVVSGHSHKPSQQEREGVIYVNPGSAGPRRFRLPVTIARVDLRPTPWQVKFVDLAPTRNV